jgi:hypothetical protein
MTDIDIDNDTLNQGLAWGAIGFGAAATLTPKVFEGIYGLKDSGELRVMTRLWGTRTALLGVVLLGAEDDDARKKLAMLAGGMNVVDAFIIATAGSEVNKRSRVLGSLTSAAFAAAYGSLVGRS